MKIFYLQLFFPSVIILSFFTGCKSSPIVFAKKKKHLSNSRRVAYEKQAFSKKASVKYSFDSTEEMKGFKIVNGNWQIKNGKLWAISGKRNRSILLTRCLQSPLLIELEVTNYANLDGSIGDITILINSENSKNFFKKGYTLTTGSYYNNCTTFYKLGRPIAKTEYSSLLSGQTYKIKIELINGHIRYWLDDKIILEAWDAKPLKLNSKLWIGIRTWNTKMTVNYFAIYEETKK